MPRRLLPAFDANDEAMRQSRINFYIETLRHFAERKLDIKDE